MQGDKDDGGWDIEDTSKMKVRLRQASPRSPFDPYQGAMSSKPPSRKRDLRKVQEWLEAKRRAERLKKDDSGA